MGRTVKIVLTKEQERWLTDNFGHTKNSECAERLGISQSSVIRLARSRGLVKEREFMEQTQMRLQRLQRNHICSMAHIRQKASVFRTGNAVTSKRASPTLNGTAKRRKPKGLSRQPPHCVLSGKGSEQEQSLVSNSAQS